MNTQRFIFKNISHYKPFYRLIAIAVAVAVAVIVGSFAVGDSVRNTLIKRVEERLGKTETVIFARYSYMDDAILQSSLREVGGLLSNGFVSISGQLIPVMVWGTDDMGIQKGEAAVNRALFDEINTVETGRAPSLQDNPIVLRLPAAGMVPLGSMYVTDTYTTSLRLKLNSVISVEQGGNINLKNEQTIPFNIFVNREELSETMGVAGKINVILSDKIISKEEFAAAWNYRYSGLNLTPVPSPKERGEDAATLARIYNPSLKHPTHRLQIGASEEESDGLRKIPNQVRDAMTVFSDRIFIQNQVVETLSPSNRIYSYLANSIKAFPPPEGIDKESPLRGVGLPYSFITAVDYYDGQPLRPDEIILSDYAAKRLNVNVNDTVSVSYFVSRQFKTLVEDSVSGLIVKKIVPLEDLQADNSLKVDFPGLSNVERCTDWNSDLPINMKLITDEDETYWTKYKNTPKALVSYSTFAPCWENAYGSATALQIDDTTRLQNLTPEMFDIQIIHPREAGVIAAKSGVDFSSLFLSLGFFIIISAAMLMMVPLSEMLFRRRNELHLLQATGFSKKRILQLLWRETNPVVFTAAVLGVVVGLAYTFLVLFLLGTVWKGATHTAGFSVYPNFITIVVGMLSGIVLSLALLYIRIVRTLKSGRVRHCERDGERHGKRNGKRHCVPNLIRDLPQSHDGGGLRVKPAMTGKKPAMTSSFIFIILLIINIFYIKSPLLFVCCGAVFLFAGWTWFNYLINKGVKMRHVASLRKLMWSALFYAKKQALLSFFTLAAGVFIVFSVGLNRRGFADATQIQTATGGFSLWCETSVPVYHNLQTEEGRTKLGLKDLPDGTQIIQLLKYSADDASCLNLNKVVTPGVLAAPLTSPPSGGLGGASIPALVDETVLQWSLGKKLGDTLFYPGEKGDTIAIVLVGTLQNSIFQGYILIDKTLFSEIWSEISGSEIMLVKTPDDKIAETKALLLQALNNYGVRITTTGERLQMFNSVTDTYLTIFLTLGGLGLLLGIFSFIIVVRKNIIARRDEITLYRSLGFNEKRIAGLLYNENIIIPLYAIAIGALASLLGVSMGFGNVSVGIWTTVALFLAIFVFCTMWFVKLTVYCAFSMVMPSIPFSIRSCSRYSL